MSTKRKSNQHSPVATRSFVVTIKQWDCLILRSLESRMWLVQKYATCSVLGIIFEAMQTAETQRDLAAGHWLS